MKYLLMIMSDEAAWSQLPPEAQQQVMENHDVLERDLRAQNKFHDCGGLGPRSGAKTVRRSLAEDRFVVTDGPFAETKEWLGGYYVVDAESVDEAVEWAKRIPAAVNVTIEVRPITTPQEPPRGAGRLTRYLLMILNADESWQDDPREEQLRILEGHGALVQELLTQNKFRDGGGLALSDSAKTVQRNGAGNCSVMDGPFAETKELMGGYYVIEAESIDEAIEWAKRIPYTVSGAVEVREIVA